MNTNECEPNRYINLWSTYSAWNSCLRRSFTSRWLGVSIFECMEQPLGAYILVTLIQNRTQPVPVSVPLSTCNLCPAFSVCECLKNRRKLKMTPCLEGSIYTAPNTTLEKDTPNCLEAKATKPTLTNALLTLCQRTLRIWLMLMQIFSYMIQKRSSG